MPFSELPELSKIAIAGVDNSSIETLVDALPLQVQRKELAGP
ncbi:unnamed protein product [Echinostoma caproni]|uniref:FH2 domain-containing protein n=1 Tax=Echinostoma caproni TaxID=27848 RepID=A0A183AVZ4_9TREM|nr:unnamed protein product [Echinostoma caproni]